MGYRWQEAKREINLSKHGLDFADAYLVYENPGKITLPSPRYDEPREFDIALVQIADAVLALVYLTEGDDVHVISFRPASRKERRLYGERIEVEEPD